MEDAQSCQSSKTETMLITFDGSKKVAFFGKCEIKLDTLTDKCLIVNVDNVFQQINTTFDQIFIQKETFLCVIDEINNNNYIVIFRDKTEAQKVLDEIHKVKDENLHSQRNDSVDEESLFMNSFYVPILKEIQAGTENFDGLKKIILNLVNSFGITQRKAYMDLLFEISFCDTKPDGFLNPLDHTEGDLTDMENKSLKVGDENNCSAVFDDNSISFDSTLNDTNGSYNLRKRSIKGIVKHEPIKDAETLVKRTSPIKRRRLSKMNDSSDNVFTEVPCHKFVGFFQNGDLSIRLIIFTSEEQTHCYEFLYHRANDNYYCKKCNHSNQITSVKVQVDEDEKVKFSFGRFQHICQPIEYLPDNYKSCEIPAASNNADENGSSNDKSNSINEKADVAVKNEPQVPQNDSGIVETSNYEIIEGSNLVAKRLFLFTSAQKTLCYEFCYNRSRNNYFCKPCSDQKLKVNVTIFDEKDGKLRYKNGQNRHICKPVRYLGVIERLNNRKETLTNGWPNHSNLNASNHEFIEFFQNGISTKRLLVFTTTNKTKCYEFYFHRIHNGYFCKKCSQKKHFVDIKIVPENNDQKKFKYGKNRHICQPFDYVPANYQSTESVKSIVTVSIETKSENTSVNIQTINTSDVKFVQVLLKETGSKRLLLFSSPEKSHCYEFYYNQFKDSYACKECNAEKRTVSVKVVKSDDGTEEIKFGQGQHICQPIEYLPDKYQEMTEASDISK